MKCWLCGGLILIASLAAFDSVAQQSKDDAIRAVENGLRLPHRMQDDSYWTIEQRMRHYGVVGFSVAVIDRYEIAWSRGYGLRSRQHGPK